MRFAAGNFACGEFLSTIIALRIQYEKGHQKIESLIGIFQVQTEDFTDFLKTVGKRRSVNNQCGGCLGNIPFIDEVRTQCIEILGRNTVCISLFWNCGTGAKYPLRSADAIVRCCPKETLMKSARAGGNRFAVQPKTIYCESFTFTVIFQTSQNPRLSRGF